jgi:hypothetical protein
MLSEVQKTTECCDREGYAQFFLDTRKVIQPFESISTETIINMSMLLI